MSTKHAPWVTRGPWITIGSVVSFWRPQPGCKDGDVVITVPGGGKDGKDTSLCIGSRGRVVQVYPSDLPRPCVNHDEGPDDCYCGGRNDAMVPGKGPYAAVEWEWTGGVAAWKDDGLRRRLIHKHSEGDSWLRVCAICDKPRTEPREDGSDWTENGGRPSHTSCALAGSVKALEQAGLREPSRKTGAKTKKGKRPKAET